MPKTLEKQYLIEAETKLNALQHRLDACYPDYPPKSLIQTYNDTLDYVTRLKAELGDSHAIG